MKNFIDRRLNPKDKSLGNRRKFLRRVRGQVKASVDEAVKHRKIADIDRGDKVGVPADGIREPRFRYESGSGRTERVLPGNKQFGVGDRIRKPPQGGGESGKEGADQGEGEDEFAFVLSREEFLDMFFEDLELPDLVKHTMKELETFKPRRAGYSVTGSPSNLAVVNTMKNAMGRRIALRRPSSQEVADLKAELFELERISNPGPKERARLIEVREEIEAKAKRQAAIPYIDPLDVRFKQFDKEPQPNANAVMFCLMDVSASMGEREKDLAKRFFVLLHLFLTRRYDKIELVFVRHTHNAQEVDEDTFFHSRETGGTVVSTALEEMRRVIDARYPATDWNIYAAQASDGDNFPGDSETCLSLMREAVMPLVQYFAYIEIIDEAEAEFLLSDDTGVELWTTYQKITGDWRNFAMKRIAKPADIYPVFRELFAKSEREAAHA
ncbi:MAG: YeaH/YhbH family protein [Pseudomonadota bacterium]